MFEFGYFYALSKHRSQAMAKQAPPTASSAATATPPDNFESALNELERIVQTMEEGEMPLENALTAYQRGITLLQFCQERLSAAEQTIKVLENGQLQTTRLDTLGKGDD